MTEFTPDELEKLSAVVGVIKEHPDCAKELQKLLSKPEVAYKPWYPDTVFFCVDTVIFFKPLCRYTEHYTIDKVGLVAEMVRVIAVRVCLLYGLGQLFVIVPCRKPAPYPVPHMVELGNVSLFEPRRFLAPVSHSKKHKTVESHIDFRYPVMLLCPIFRKSKIGFSKFLRTVSCAAVKKIAAPGTMVAAISRALGCLRKQICPLFLFT